MRHALFFAVENLVVEPAQQEHAPDDEQDHRDRCHRLYRRREVLFPYHKADHRAHDDLDDDDLFDVEIVGIDVVVVDQKRVADEQQRADDRDPKVAVAIPLDVEHHRQAEEEQQLVLNDREHDIVGRRHRRHHAVGRDRAGDYVAERARQTRKRRQKARLFEARRHRHAHHEVGKLRILDRIFGIVYDAIVDELNALVSQENARQGHRNDVRKFGTLAQLDRQDGQHDRKHQKYDRIPPIFHFLPFRPVALRARATFDVNVLSDGRDLASYPQFEDRLFDTAALAVRDARRMPLSRQKQRPTAFPHRQQSERRG